MKLFNAHSNPDETQSYNITNLITSSREANYYFHSQPESVQQAVRERGDEIHSIHDLIMSVLMARKNIN